MNVIFTAVILLSALILIFIAPDKFLSSLMDGAENSLRCALTLFCIYAVWMGLSRVAEDCGLCEKLSRVFKPAVRKLFATQNENAVKDITMNLTCNVLGLGGAATPFGVNAINQLDEDKNAFAQKLLFILNATSVQILPTTVIALRTSFGSVDPTNIFLPSLLSTFVCTFFAVFIFIIFIKIKGTKGRRWQ